MGRNDLKANGTRPLSDALASPNNGEASHDSADSQTGLNHPLAVVIGGFADDPLWDEFQEEIARYRREIDAKFYPAE